ncbi:hypothetical protein D6D23_04265 [Aureobasidium pullulans]|uniref:Uncharacterized protein n=1 Tax=Aureobasidium pullulans TaxID=5580 RepID=A0A4S8WI40_AURPU|nr:hypothetical protein D6D23_04265 [Aureobasidium pullulans]THZ74270.1 hypothetical protein D6C85_03571 [Aureobasidium pullulans]
MSPFWTLLLLLILSQAATALWPASTHAHRTTITEHHHHYHTTTIFRPTVPTISSPPPEPSNFSPYDFTEEDLVMPVREEVKAGRASGWYEVVKLTMKRALLFMKEE